MPRNSGFAVLYVKIFFERKYDPKDQILNIIQILKPH